MMRKSLLVAGLLMSGVTLAGTPDEGLVQEKSHKAWHLTIGPVLSPRVRVKVSGPRVALPTRPPAGWQDRGTGATPPAETGSIMRDYVDGYVYPDEGSGGDNITWNWGADNVSGGASPQYSSENGGTMKFRTDMTSWTESYSSTAYNSGSGSESDRDFLVGVEAIGGWTFYDNGTFDAAVDAGFRFYGSGYLDAESRYGTSVTTTRSEFRYVDSYDASGWNPVPVGGFAGYPGGPDYLMGSIPMRRDLEEMPNDPTKSRTYDYYYQGDTRLIYRIWDLRLGPTLGWQATDYLVLRGGVYGLLGLVDATLKTDANTHDGPRNASTSTCGAVFGMAFGGSAQLYLTEDLFIYGSAEYDWWTDSVDLNAGGANAEVKLSDFVIALGMGIEF